MSREKRGGRESGESGTKAPPNSQAASAANPAAPAYEECATCHFPSLERWPREHEIELHERIRALEARNKELVAIILREQERHGCGVRSQLTEEEIAMED